MAASLLFCANGFGATVFDNTASTNYLDRTFFPGNAIEFGDQVFLAGNERRITDFQFEYFLGANANGNEQAELFFYQNNGAGGTAPGTRLYSSGAFPLDKGFQTVLAQGLSVTVGNTFTWAVRFAGIDLGEQAGLLVFDPPIVGASFDDFWVRDTAGNWTTFLIDGGAVPANFSARVIAVPEPTTLAFAISMGLVWLGFRAYRKRA
ncbi:MAG: hypothetical protein FJ398_00555 [Verrucomicrobia bacterium]|nr:hypothetical protein [Verrucomicrobiota bacterium]